VLSEHVTPYDLVNPALVRAPMDIHSTAGLMQLDRLITDQSAMLAYIGDFRLMMVLTLLALPCLLLFRPRNRRP